MLDDDDSLVIRSSQDSASLTLGRVDDADYSVLSVRWGESLSATLRSYFFGDAPARLFREMATDWRGWPGEKCWETVEGDLRLVATHDGLGHVRCDVALVPVYGEWSVRVAIMLDAGALDDVARAAERFYAG